MSRSLRPTARLSAESLEARALMSAVLSTPPNPDLGTADLIGLLRPADDVTTTPPEPDRAGGGVTTEPPEPDRTASYPPDPYRVGVKVEGDPPGGVDLHAPPSDFVGHPDLMLPGVYVDGGKVEPPDPDRAAIDFCRPGEDQEGIIVINMPGESRGAVDMFYPTDQKAVAP